MDPGTLYNLETVKYTGYRLPDEVFWAFPVLALLICAIHAARRAFRHPSPANDGAHTGTSERAGAPGRNGQSGKHAQKIILRYTVAQRLFHWINASACLLLLLSGLAIYSPGMISGSVPTATWFAWHRWLAVVLILGITFHVIYDGYVRDSFGFMWFDKDVRRMLGRIAKNFLGLTPVYPRYGKYHPMQLGSHWAMAGCLFALIITGLILWKPARIFFPFGLLGLDWDFIFFCRTLHGFFSASFLALIIGHVYFAVVIRKNWTISKSMLTGKVDYDDYVGSHVIIEERPVSHDSKAEEVRA